MSTELYSTDWSAYEELRLHDAIAEHGISNWKRVSEDMDTKNSDACEEHFRNACINFKMKKK